MNWTPEPVNYFLSMLALGCGLVLCWSGLRYWVPIWTSWWRRRSRTTNPGLPDSLPPGNRVVATSNRDGTV